MLGMVARFLDGIRITPDTLSVEQIKQLGPGGNYMELQAIIRNAEDTYD